MKTYLKTIFLSAVALLLATAVHAYDFTAVNEDGITIFYNITNKTNRTCEVTFALNDSQSYIGYKTPDIYIGDIRIPETVSYNSKDYTVTCIGSSAFSACIHMTSIELPNTITSIGSGAFAGCRNLTSFRCPDSITIIEDRTFNNCTGLASITIPNTVTTIGEMAFAGCRKLTTIEIPNGVTKIDYYAFTECTGLTSVIIPNTVTTIEQNAFSYCVNLTSVTIPDGVTEIKYQTFANCTKLTSLTIGGSVKKMHTNAFYNDEALRTIISKIRNPFPIASYLLSYSTLANGTLYVPKGTKAAYQATEGWADFTTIEEGAMYYQLTLTADEGGSIIYDGSRIKNNTSRTFFFEEEISACITIEPDEHYKLVSLTMDGKNVTDSMEGNTFILKNIDRDVEISATFEGDANTETIVLQSDMQTFCCNKDLDFNSCGGLEAYIVSGFKPETNEVLLTRVSEVPAGTGLIIRGEAGKKYLVIGKETSFIYLNFLKGVLSDTSLSAGYLLNGDVFEIVNTPTIIHANNAYLSLPASVQSAKILSLKFSEESTNIDLVEDDMPQGDSHWYSLQGMRLNGTPSTPGIYIRNGRKVMVK